MASEGVRLYKEVRNDQWPIVYSRNYDISFFGMEKVHPFDSGKWGKIIGFLRDAGMLTNDTIVEPNEAQEEELRVVHSQRYLNSLKTSCNVAAITEVCPLSCIPNVVVQRKVLKPFRYQTGGSILAARLAVDRGWAINVGGGFHHCSSTRGGGFCAYADITLAIRFLFNHVPERVKQAMIIDLDAHQGNGHERDFADDDNVFILDVYNRGIYPMDDSAKRAINRKVELHHLTEDAEYLRKVEKNVRECLAEFKPDFVLFNAGTDILEHDPLGALSITGDGIIRRDEIVFREVRAKNTPILMVTSGGYQRRTARIIADSILNLKEKGLISVLPPVNTTERQEATGGVSAPEDVRMEESGQKNEAFETAAPPAADMTELQ